MWTMMMTKTIFRKVKKTLGLSKKNASLLLRSCLPGIYSTSVIIMCLIVSLFAPEEYYKMIDQLT